MATTPKCSFFRRLIAHLTGCYEVLAQNQTLKNELDVLRRDFWQDVPFCTTPASRENAVRLFQGRWICQIPGFTDESGGMKLFGPDDPRPQQAAQAFGGIKDFRILELGPCEAAHTYQLESLGSGPITAVEANKEYFLRCLVVKEVLSLKAHFLLGDFMSYLNQTTERYDMIFASGVFYHLTDPVRFIASAKRCAPRLFIWTHYLEEKDISKIPSRITVRFKTPVNRADY